VPRPVPGLVHPCSLVPACPPPPARRCRAPAPAAALPTAASARWRRRRRPRRCFAPMWVRRRATCTRSRRTAMAGGWGWGHRRREVGGLAAVPAWSTACGQFHSSCRPASFSDCTAAARQLHGSRHPAATVHDPPPTPPSAPPLPPPPPPPAHPPTHPHTTTTAVSKHTLLPPPRGALQARPGAGADRPLRQDQRPGIPRRLRRGVRHRRPRRHPPVGAGGVQGAAAHRRPQPGLPLRGLHAGGGRAAAALLLCPILLPLPRQCCCPPPLPHPVAPPPPTLLPPLPKQQPLVTSVSCPT
jgi:hypothetical protein